MVSEQSSAARGRRQPGPMTLSAGVSRPGQGLCPPQAGGFERTLQPQSPALSAHRPRTGQKKRRRTPWDMEAELGGMRPQAKGHGRGRSRRSEPREGARPAHARIGDLWPPEL